jgi:nucleotidyltransferase substrate binding protein (TIGR01987 family)
MNDKSKLAIKKLSQAFGRLQEAVAEPPSSLQADAVLQRFEFTFELLWKALKIYLAEKEGIEVSSPKGTLKAAFREGLIKSEDEETYLKMLEDRNASTHVYDQQEAGEIYARIRDVHLPPIKALISRLEKQI